MAVQQLKEYNGLNNDLIKAGQTLKVPPSTYEVLRGDTLFSIAKKFGITVKELQEINNLLSHDIYAGQTITLIGKTEKTNMQQLQQQKTTFYGKHVESGTYIVAPGDTLWSIAKRFHITVETIKETNSLQQDYVLIGQKLTIQAPKLYQVDVDVVGAVDNSSIEVLISGYNDPVVLNVPYGMGNKFDLYSGAVINIIYQDTASPSLVEFHFQ